MPDIKCQMDFLSSIAQIGIDKSLVGVILKNDKEIKKQIVYIELRDDGFYLLDIGYFSLTENPGIYYNKVNNIFMSILSYRSSLQTVQEFYNNFDSFITESEKDKLITYQKV